MKVKFKANKKNIYKGKYEQIFNIINKGSIFDFSKAYQSDNGKIVNGYWIFEIVNEDNEPIQLDYDIEQKIRNIKDLEII